MTGGTKKSKKIHKPANRLATSSKELKRENSKAKKKKTGYRLRVRKVISRKKAVEKNNLLEKRQIEREQAEERIMQSEVKKKTESRLDQVQTKPKPKELTPEEKIEIYKKIEKEKKIIMWSGVTFFMVLITFFWLYNLNLQFKNSQKAKDGEGISDWGKEMSKRLDEIKENIEKVKEIQTMAANTSSSTLEFVNNLSGTSTTEIKIPSEIQEDLKKRLEEQKNN